MCCLVRFFVILLSFFFNDTATTEIYTLSLHDALPISVLRLMRNSNFVGCSTGRSPGFAPFNILSARSEEHTSELQSLRHLVCRLLLEKKKKNNKKKSSFITYTTKHVQATKRTQQPVAT